MLNEEDATERLKALYNGLIADCERAEKARGNSDDQYSRRVSIRALFAMIEGLSFSMKDVVRSTLSELPEAAAAKLGFGRADLAILHEESYTLKDNGSVKAGTSFMKLIPNLRFAMSSYARLLTVSFTPDCTAPGWLAFKDLVSIRNRITHPKKTNDLEVTDEDLSAFLKGGAWHRDTMTDLFEACTAIQEPSEDG